jgi:drug/metabolite transporter (DMT)-like permease
MEKSYWYAVIAAVCFGSIIFGGQIFVDMGFSTYEISVFRMLPGLFLLPLVLLKKEYRITKEMLPTFLVFGIVGGIGLFAEYAALAFGVPVAVVVFLLYTQPLWTSVLGKFFLKEKITKNKIYAILISLLGIIIMINPFEIASTNLMGILLALVSGICMSIWIIYGRKFGKKKIHPITTTVGYVIPILLFFILTQPLVDGIVQDQSLTRLSFDISPEVMIYFAIFSLVSVILPYFFVFKALKKADASDVGIIMLLEPIAGSLLAFLILSQPLTLNIIVGGLLILASNYLVVKK